MTKNKIGIIQSRGIGDLVIALPIAKYYYDDGYEVFWPICEPFMSSMVPAAPWVNWISVPVDPQGRFFYETPNRKLREVGITEKDQLWLYQYLNSHPDKTNKSLFAQMKFDQYKYAAVGLPFSLKWTLDKCITRNPAREQSLFNRVVKQERYMIYQNHASDMSYDIDLSVIDPEVQRIEITELTDSIFDWLKIIEGAETIILIDSVFANLIDQLKIAEDADKYYMRKWNRRVDGNPVLLGAWTFVDVEEPDNTQVKSLADTGLK